MPAIYSTGKRNLGFFGSDDKQKAKRALDCMQHILADMRAATDDFQRCEEVVFDEASGHLRYSFDDFQAKIDFEALEYFFELPWFRYVFTLRLDEFGR